jgi:hypothetical protein
MLVCLSHKHPPDAQYTTDTPVGPRYSMNVVKVFTATPSQHNQDAMYTESLSSASNTHVMVATTVIGVCTTNIADVDRAVTHNSPIISALGDLWHQVERCGRGEGRTSNSYILLLFLLSNREGLDPDNKDDPAALQSQRPRIAPRSQHLQPLVSRKPAAGRSCHRPAPHDEPVAPEHDSRQFDETSGGAAGVIGSDNEDDNDNSPVQIPGDTRKA